MITCNGIVGICAARRRAARGASRRSTPRARRPRWPPSRRSPRSRLVLPTFTTSRPARSSRPRSSPSPPSRRSRSTGCSSSSRPSATATTSCPWGTRRRADEHAAPPSDRAALDEPRAARRRARRGRRSGEDRVAGDRGRRRRRSAPRTRRSASSSRCSCSLPETLAAVRNARRGRVQTSFNLAFGSAMASIGLTIPAIAVASIWLDGPLVLGPRADPDGPARHHGGRRRAHRAARGAPPSRRAACTWRSSRPSSSWPSCPRGVLRPRPRPCRRTGVCFVRGSGAGCGRSSATATASERTTKPAATPNARW